MAFEKFKLDRKVKKAEKDIAKKERLAKTYAEAGDKLSDIAMRSDKASTVLRAEQSFEKHLDHAKLDSQIHEARQRLFIQRSRLLKRVIRFNKEYKFTLTKPDTPVKERELKRCSTGAKNAAYALGVVDDAIDRLDSIRDEYEWREIMRDLTNAYKLMNAISVGADLMTRLAFWVQKARNDLKQDISVKAMEHYYGKSINKLLEEQTGNESAAEMLVKDSVLDLDNEDAVLDSIRWGTAYTVMPQKVSEIAAEQSTIAEANGEMPVIQKPGEAYESAQDLPEIDFDNMPGLI